MLTDGVGTLMRYILVGTPAFQSLKQIFSKGPNFTAIEQSGCSGRTLNLNFFREVLIASDSSKPESCRERFDALVERRRPR
jgi:hypothetical protein